MTVSILIPYAGEPRGRLDRTVKSALNCLPDEVIVYGDGYEHMLFDELKSACKVARSEKNLGLPHAINQAREMATSTHVMWLSTGDTVDSRRLMYTPPDDKGQFCRVDVRSQKRTIPEEGHDWEKGIFKCNQFCGSAMIVPVRVWDAVGGFQEWRDPFMHERRVPKDKSQVRVRYCSDWSFAVRVQAYCGWEMVPHVLSTANEYPDGLTKTADQKRRSADDAAVARLAKELGRKRR